ncbi:MAG TPA: hypothetical protein VN634_15375 [Candidatus Limnocylindrales bacterium]|nr:hypothetical protein [Candidatus Limnocylindrales bacterium]
MKTFRPVLASALVSLIVLPVVAFAAGGVDPSFGAAGIATLAVEGRNASYSDVVVQPDGKILAAGAIVENPNTDQQFSRLLLVRYNADGTLDSGFGTGGTVVTEIGKYAYTQEIALQADGKIVAVGTAYIGDEAFFWLNRPQFALVRYESDGTLDATFGVGGIVTSNYAEGEHYLSAVQIQTSGRIVVAGQYGADEVILVGYDSNGQLDPTFGSSTPGVFRIVTAMARFADQSLVVVGYNLNGFLLMRYTANGQLDPTFGSGGVVNTHVSQLDPLSDVAIQDDGKIVVTGFVVGEVGYDLAVARYNGDGALDPTFGGTGIVRGPVEDDSAGYGLVVLDNGSIVVGGLVWHPVPNREIPETTTFELLRFSADGVLDPTFHLAGEPRANQNQINALTLQPDGRILAAGLSGSNNDGQLVFDAVLTRHFAGTCGDGDVEDLEQCDDGNATSGDGCDANCTFTGCGNGIQTTAEQCDGGECCTSTCMFRASGTACTSDSDVCTDDQCDSSGLCAHVANSSPCDDANACTSNDVCSDGVCAGTTSVFCATCEYCQPDVGTCILAPRPDCTPTVGYGLPSELAITTSALDSRRQLKWTWSEGGETSLEDLGSPQTTDTYEVCMFRNENDLAWNASLPAGSRWTTGNRKGFQYRDSAGSSQGIRKLQLRTGPNGQAGIQLRAKGAQLSPPSLDDGALPIVLQLQRGNEACWQATFETPTSGLRSAGSTTQTVRYQGR